MNLGGRRKEGKEPAGESRTQRRADSGIRLTNASCTAPQKHVAVASSSLDHPSSAPPAKGI